MSKFKFDKSKLETDLPRIPWSAVEALDDGTVIPATVHSISTYEGEVTLHVEYDDHLMRVRAWDFSKQEAIGLIGQDIKIFVYTNKAGKKTTGFRLTLARKSVNG